MNPAPALKRFFLPLAVLILLVAAALRLWQLHAYPPGPHYDEAAYLLITRSIAFGGARPFPIVEAYQGREVLYMYLNAPLLYLFGDRIFTLQVTSAFLNLITIAASVTLGRLMFRGERGLIIGLVVGVLIALSFPQIFLARQAFRAVSLPFCQALALAFLWRGLVARRRDWLWLALGGVFAGLALYTYMASRLFPLWLALGGLVLVVASQQRRLRLRQGMVFFGVLGLVALPMLVYAVQRPDVFFARLSEVTRPGESITFAQSLLIHARMFFIEGDPYLRYNIPGRPYLTWPEGLLMLVGLVVALARLVRPGRPTERAASALALLAPLMVIPSLISVGGLPPNHMRSLGMVPLIFVLVALGFEAVYTWVARRAPRTLALTRSFSALLLVVLGVGAFLVGQAYFAWAGRADLYYEADADLAAAARWLPAQAGPETVVYVAARDRGHPTVEIADTPPVTWLGTDSLFRAPPSMEGLYVFPRSAPPPADWLQWLEPYRLNDLPLGPDGRTAFEAFRVPGAASLPPAPAPPAVSNPYLTLVGVHLPVIAAGGRADVTLDWRISAPPPVADFTPILQLETEHGDLLARAEAYMTDTDRWRPGEILMQRLRVRVPFGTPPGVYPLRAAWVARSTETYQPYTVEGAQAGIWATLGMLEVIRPSDYPDPAELEIQVRQPIEIAPGARLLGLNPPASSVRPGEVLRPVLFWQAAPTVEARPSIIIEALLRGPDGDTLLWSGAPANGRHPSNSWVDGELVADRAHWPVPRDLPAAAYTLLIRAEGVEVELAQVEVTGLPRVFEAPSVETVVHADYSDAVRLYGYTLAPYPSGLDVEIVWQSLSVTQTDYTVFVHVVDEAGQIAAQRDAMPHLNGYPTSLWAVGEYISDTYTFQDLPPGSYHIRIGLYTPADGRRLPVRVASQTLENGYVQTETFRVMS